MNFPDERSLWSIPQLALRSLQAVPDNTFVEEVDGGSETYFDFIGRAASLAHDLSELGVKAGEVVAIILPNGIPALHAWLAIALTGATEMPLRHGLSGDLLYHPLTMGRCRTVIADHDGLLALRAGIEKLPWIENVILVGGADTLGRDGHSFRVHSYETIIALRCTSPQLTSTSGDIASIMLTSGTSGPSKGVMIPHAQACLIARSCIAATRTGTQDVFYCVHPLNHIAGKFMIVLSALATGGKLILDAKFDAEHWLERVRRYGVTVSIAHGPMLEMLAATTETSSDRDHKLRRLMCSPMPKQLTASFEARFGVRRIEMWGMTETGCATWTDLDTPHPIGSAGKTLDGFYEIQIADPATDEPLPAGQVGEILVRSKHPFTMMQGYLAMSEETQSAWRNLWFHTGDAGYFDAEGNLYFVERLKDRIRSRSENISSYDIERAALSVDGIIEAAAVGVSSEFEGDDDIKLYLVSESTRPDPEAILRVMAKQLPHFMIPRYVEFISELPRTPTSKVRKNVLRQNAFASAHWDRKARGYACVIFIPKAKRAESRRRRSCHSANKRLVWRPMGFS